MKLYCPKCNSERITTQQVNPERVSIDEYFSKVKTSKDETRTIEIKCLDCGYSKTQDVSV